MATPSTPSPSDEPTPTTPPLDLPPDPLLQPGSFIDAQNADPEPEPDLDSTTKNTPDLSTPKNNPAAEDAVPERPSWLPPGWKMTFKVRESGATAGSTDRYYVEPVSGRRLRSRKEVEYFLETGSKKKKRTLPSADGAPEVQPSESPGVSKKKKSNPSSKKAPPPLNFDFENVPEMTSWKLTDAANDNWMPFIDDKMVSKSIKQDWDSAFQFLASGTSKPM